MSSRTSRWTGPPWTACSKPAAVCVAAVERARCRCVCLPVRAARDGARPLCLGFAHDGVACLRLLRTVVKPACVRAMQSFTFQISSGRRSCVHCVFACWSSGGKRRPPAGGRGVSPPSGGVGRGRGDAGGIGGPAEPSRLRGLLPLSVRNGWPFAAAAFAAAWARRFSRGPSLSGGSSRPPPLSTGEAALTSSWSSGLPRRRPPIPRGAGVLGGVGESGWMVPPRFPPSVRRQHRSRPQA